jgi:hypothetical protein
MPDIPEGNIPKEYKPLNNIFYKPFEQDYKNLLCSPTTTKMLTNPESVHIGNIKLIPFNYGNLIPTEEKDDSFYVLKSIS